MALFEVASFGACGVDRQLEDVQRVARVAAGAARDHLGDVLRHLDLERSGAAADDVDQRLDRMGLELVDLRP